MSNQQQIYGSKYVWLMPKYNETYVVDLMSKFGISKSIAIFLAARGLDDFDTVYNYLNSSEKDVPHASLLKDADKAVDRIKQAIDCNEKILIVGDYDVDGITSSSILMTCMPLIGAKINFYLPNRVKDGYGLSNKIVEKAAKYGYKIIITVDNGISAVEPARRAKELGIDLIITDHHRPQEILPPAYAVIDPHQDDCKYPYKYLAGVGVTFKLVSLIFEKFNKKLPTKVYELLLLGTVADVVPLTGENRYWVKNCLQLVNKKHSMSLNYLKNNSNCSVPEISSLDIGFFLAPQINALGRLDDARDGVYFLIGSDQDKVFQIGQNLKNFNDARKEIEKDIFEEIEFKIKNKEIDLDKELIIMAGSKNWPAGVIGLVASRFVSKYGRPTILFHLTEDGLAKGSCRSITAFNMFDALQENSDLLKQFGGHSVAAGLALEISNLPKLKKLLEKRASDLLTNEDLLLKISIDSLIDLSEINDSLIKQISQLEPFGHQNESPVFLIKNVVHAKQPYLMKGLHIKCYVKSDESRFYSIPVVFFNRPELWDLVDQKSTFDIVVKITQNYWQGKYNTELIGIDIKLNNN